MNKIRLMLYCPLILAATLMVGGCASGTADRVASASGVDAQLAQLQMQEQSLAAREAELQQQAQQLQEQMRAAGAAEAEAYAAQARARESLEQARATPASAADDSLFPPAAEPGHCYARLLIPAQYQTVTEKILKHDAGERVEIIPARYETVKEQVLVEEASQKLETIPAKYGFVDEQVLVKPAAQKMVEVPARYETVTERILVKPAHTVWKKGSGPIQRIDDSTGEIMCLVEVPDEFRTVSKQVLKSPATTRVIDEPAVYQTVKKRVVIEAPQTRTVEIPAKYKTVSVTKLVTPAQEKRIPVPAEYQTVSKRMKTADEHMEWREILCETNMTHGKISQIQRELQKAGYNPGPIDGVIGSQTMSAVNAFQKDKNLTVSKYLTMNTIKALNVTP